MSAWRYKFNIFVMKISYSFTVLTAYDFSIQTVNYCNLGCHFIKAQHCEQL